MDKCKIFGFLDTLKVHIHTNLLANTTSRKKLNFNLNSMRCKSFCCAKKQEYKCNLKDKALGSYIFIYLFMSATFNLNRNFFSKFDF